MKRLTVHLIINISSDLTSSLINCTRLNLSSQKLSIKDQSLSDSSFCNMLSSECWSFSTVSLKSFVVPKSMKSLKKYRLSMFSSVGRELGRDYSPREMKRTGSKTFGDCTDSFTANATENFIPRTSCSAHKRHDKREPGLFKEEFRCSEMLCLCRKTYCCFDRKSNKYKFSSKGLNKRTLEVCGEGPMSNYRKVLEEAVIVTSTNRGFRTMKHSVATYEQTKKGSSYFFPKRLVEEDGIHTKPLDL